MQARVHIAPAVTDRKTLIISGKARCTSATNYKRIRGTKPTFILYIEPHRMFSFECWALEYIRVQANSKILCFHVTVANLRFYRCVYSVKLVMNRNLQFEVLSYLYRSCKVQSFNTNEKKKNSAILKYEICVRPEKVECWTSLP